MKEFLHWYKLLKLLSPPQPLSQPAMFLYRPHSLHRQHTTEFAKPKLKRGIQVGEFRRLKRSQRRKVRDLYARGGVLNGPGLLGEETDNRNVQQQENSVDREQDEISVEQKSKRNKAETDLENTPSAQHSAAPVSWFWQLLILCALFYALTVFVYAA